MITKPIAQSLVFVLLVTYFNAPPILISKPVINKNPFVKTLSILKNLNQHYSEVLIRRHLYRFFVQKEQINTERLKSIRFYLNCKYEIISFQSCLTSSSQAI